MSSSPPPLTTTRRHGPGPETDDDDSTSVLIARRRQGTTKTTTIREEPSSLVQQPLPPEKQQHQPSILIEKENHKNYDKNEPARPTTTTTTAMDLHDGRIDVVYMSSEPPSFPPLSPRPVPPFINNSSTGIFPDGLSVTTTSTTTTTTRPGAVRVGSVGTHNSTVDGGMTTTATSTLSRTLAELDTAQNQQQDDGGTTLIEAYRVTDTPISTTPSSGVPSLVMNNDLPEAEVQYLICGLSKQWFLRWVLGMILLVTIGIVLGVYLSGRNTTTTSRGVNDIPTTTIQPTFSIQPTSSMQPTSSPTLLPFETVVSELGNIVTSSDMVNTTSIPYRAIDWLATNINSNPDISIKEQYAVIELYLSSGGENWNRRGNWMSSNAPICIWQGINDCIGVAGSNTVTITDLYLGENNLLGIIPSSIGLLTGLTYLDIYRNALTGTIQTQIGQLTNLAYLDLAGNALRGTIPTQIGKMTNLDNLKVDWNELTGTIPTEIGQLTNLIILWLHDNSLTGTIPTQIGQLANVKDLWLYINDLTGTIPTQIGQLANLELLDFDDNVGLTGDINSIFCDGKEYLGSFSQLSTVYTSSTQLDCNCCSSN